MKFGIVLCLLGLFYELSAQRFNETSVGHLLSAPPIIIDSINDPSPGYIFMATWDRNVPAVYGNFIFILDKNGSIVDSVRVQGAPMISRFSPMVSRVMLRVIFPPTSHCRERN